MNKLLERTRVQTIDFLSMDIEGAELAAHNGFDIEKYKPRLVCVEIQKGAGRQTSRPLHTARLQAHRGVPTVRSYQLVLHARGDNLAYEIESSPNKPDLPLHHPRNANVR